MLLTSFLERSDQRDRDLLLFFYTAFIFDKPFSYHLNVSECSVSSKRAGNGNTGLWSSLVESNDGLHILGID